MGINTPNRYQRYLNARSDYRDEQSRLEQKRQSTENLLSTAATIGGIVGGVVAYKRGAFDSLLSKALDRPAVRGVINQGRRLSILNDTYKASVSEMTSGRFSKFMDPDYKNFNSILKRRLSQAGELTNPLSKRSKLQETVDQFYKGVDARRHSLTDQAKLAEFRASVDADTAIPDKVKQILSNTIDKSKNSDRFLGQAELGQIETLLKETQDRHGYTGDIKGLAQQIRNHVDAAQAKHDEIFNSDTITGQLKKLTSTFVKEVNNHYKKGDTGRSLVGDLLGRAGYKRATVSDVATRDTLSSLGDHFNTFAADMQKQGFDVTKLALQDDIFVDGAGKLVDARYITERARGFYNYMATNFQIPFVNLNPLRLSHGVMLNSIKEADDVVLMKKGTVSPGASVTNQFQEDVMYMFGRIFNMNGEQMYGGREFTLAPADHGMAQRVLSDWLGLGEKDLTGNIFKDVLDIGNQRNQSALGRKFSAVTKFKDPGYVPNILNRMRSSTEVDLEDAESLFRQLTSNLYRNTGTLGNDTVGRVFDMMTKSGSNPLEALGLSRTDLMMETQDDIIRTLSKILDPKNTAYQQNSKFIRSLSVQMNKEMGQYKAHPEEYLRTLFSSSEAEIPLPGVLDTLSPNKTDMLPRTEQVKRLIQQDIIQYASEGGALGNIESVFDANSSKTMKEMLTLNRLLSNIDEVKATRYGNGQIGSINLKRKNLLQEFSDEIKSGEGSYGYVSEIVQNRFPWWSYGPGEEIERPFAGQKYIAVSKTSSLYKDQLTQINQAIKNQNYGGAASGSLSTSMDFLKGLFASRDNMQNMSTASFVPYYAMHRLNDALNTVGLGLSSRSLKSAGGIFGNLLLKRFGAVLLGVNILTYLGYETEKLTGTDPKDVLADTYANMTLDAARMRDAIGVTQFNRMSQSLFPGSEHLFENPIGGAVKFLTAGMIGETRGYDDLMKYYQNGSDPIRQGRWWGWSSNTPWYGGQIQYYKPNWYRRMKSDYQYTDSMYGSKDEFWDYNLMPTPDHPLSTLRALLDPNHFQRRNREDRPYPVEGGSPIGELPIVGPLYEATIGRILTPKRLRGDFKQAHYDYLRALNEEIKSQYQNNGNALYVTASGAGQVANVQGGGGGYAPPGDSVTVMDGTGSGAGLGPAGARAGSAGYKRDLTEINQRTIARTSVGSPDYTSISRLRSIENIADLYSTVDPTSVGANLNEMYYNITEVAGIYGFATNLVFGENYKKQKRLAESTAMTSIGKQFWNMDLGGLGGEVSEITRRFLPRDIFGKTTYNPYRNGLPDWMPFDLRYGDQYAQIPNGTYRLPGAGYESMNSLHPDMFGRYGAIDRFKILADVSPYSNQFRYYAKVMSLYNANGMLSESENDQVQEIKKQVAKRKKKYEFTPYRFKYASLTKKRVRITGMIDSTTFMVDGYSSPIRLAGIDMPAIADNSQAAIEAREYLGSRISVGKDIVIGLNSDPLARTSDDTLGTMRAVAYTLSGENINNRLTKFQNGTTPVVKFKLDDNTATSAIAIHGDNAVLGRIWESFTHLDNPFSTKFLQIQSPLESYKRRQVYGKDFRTWDNPWRGFVVPLVDSMGTSNPIVGTAVGALVGSLFGTKSKTGGRAAAAKIGAIIGGGASTLRTFSDIGELFGGETHIPGRRIQQRDIEEYFDILKYIKYKGLYDRTRALALRKEGVDVEKMTRNTEDEKGILVKARKRKLEKEKRFLKLEMADSKSDAVAIKARLAEINNELEGLAGAREVYPIGNLSQLALQYKHTYESTLYGAPDNAPIKDLFAALPKNEREYLGEFLTAAPEEREEILRLLPKNERRFFQAKWGLAIDKKQDLNQYFKSHYLPGANWDGWKPDVSLESVKVKVLRKEGLDASDFGFYPQDVQASIGAPGISDYHGGSFSGAAIQSAIKKIASGLGVQDIDIMAQTVPAYVRGLPKVEITMNTTNDNMDEHIDNLNSYYSR